MNKVLTIIMAGGAGTRLSVLADRRAKPAVPFAGIYRIIDFTLSNVMHSGGRRVGVITQYRPYSLADHIGQGEPWGMNGFDCKARTLSPHTGDENSAFYCNTADAIYRNIEFIERFPDATEVLILSGDHIYQMDYRPMLALHRDCGAKLTLATQPVPWEETSRFGIMVHDERGRITQFQEKPKSDPLSNKASLGIYVFDRQCLIDALTADQADPGSEHDFGGDVIPRLIESEPCYNYDFEDYWRDVGTIPSYMDTSMEALRPRESGLDIEAWGVRTNHHQIPLSQQHPSQIAAGASVRDAMISKGSLIEGEVSESILSPGVHIGRGARVHRSIILHDVKVEAGAVINNAIIDKHVVIERDAVIGDPELGEAINTHKPELLCTGTSVVGKFARVPAGLRMGVNCLVYPGVTCHLAQGGKAPAGSTFHVQDASLWRPVTTG